MRNKKQNKPENFVPYTNVNIHEKILPVKTNETERKFLEKEKSPIKPSHSRQPSPYPLLTTGKS